MLRSRLPSPGLAFRFVSARQLACFTALGVALACSSSDDGDANMGNGGTTTGIAGTGGAPGAAGTAGASSGAPSAGGDAGATAQGGSGGVSAAGAAGTGSTAVAICPEGSLFCDDFEQAALGAVAAPWRTSANAATVVVDEVQAFSGTKAVHVNAPQAGTYHRGYFALDQGSSANIFPAVAQEMYGRAMMYLPVLPNADVHWTFIQGEGVAAASPDVPTHNALYRYGGQHQNGAQLMANYETTTPVATDCWDHSASVLPTAKWTCVEWHFKVATNEMQFWLEGNELADIHVIDRGEGCGGDDLGGQWLAPPAFQTLYLGWEHYQQTQNPIDLWVDAVVVDTKRVGCPAEPQ
jgi:polysaccharide lyase-like protein